MTNKKKAKQATNRKAQDHTPRRSYSLPLALSKKQFNALAKEPFQVIHLKLVEPFVRDGQEYWWCVQPIKFTPEGKIVFAGDNVICRDEAEADATQQNLVTLYKREEEMRLRAEAERPIPGETRGMVYVVEVHSITAEGTPLSSILAQGKNSTVSSESPLPDAAIVDVGNLYWKGGDNSGQAMKAVITKSVHTVNAFRLVRYTDPIQTDGRTFRYGVEYAQFAEYSPKSEVLRVMERCLVATEAEAMAMMKQKEIDAPKLRARLLNEPVKSAEELKEEATINTIQAMANGAHDLAAKERHLKRIEAIRGAQRERTRLAAEAAAEQARDRAAEVKAFNILMDENFPTVAKVKAELKVANLQPSPEYWENIRRAMKIDCARLGISSPFNHFVMDDKFTLDVTKALKSKSPIKPDQVTAVLNWVSKDYQAMKEEEWTADVAEKIRAPVKPSGLGKTISQKFGLKSKLKGRPETESGKNSKG